jgi:hypothetical protein
LSGAAGRHDQTLYPSGKIERHLKPDPATHRVAENVGRPDLEMVQKRNDVIGHLIDCVDLLARPRPPGATRIVDDEMQAFRQSRHLIGLPDFRRESRRGNQHQRLSGTLALIVKIDAGR